jgi:hypothetical protein
MKRLLLAFTILAAASSFLCALHLTTIQLKRNVAETGLALASETQLLAQAQIQLKSVTEQVHDLKQKLRLQQQTGAGSSEDDEILSGQAHLSPAQSERLLAELGFNWASSPDYVIVSKDTLRAISIDAVRAAKLKNPVCQVLAISPEERAGIDAATLGLIESYWTWAQAHVQREEPSGDVVAKYALPADPDFSQSLSNNFANAALTTLGNERGALLLDYARSWMLDLGMGGYGGDNSLTVKRYQSGEQSHLSYELKYSGNIMNNDVSPYLEFPVAFQPLFPNGWPDLARREGFDLPKDFRK